MKHSGNITFRKSINSARQMRPQSLAEEPSGTIKETLETAQSVGCNAEHHPHDIPEDIHSSVVGWPAS